MKRRVSLGVAAIVAIAGVASAAVVIDDQAVDARESQRSTEELTLDELPGEDPDPPGHASSEAPEMGRRIHLKLPPNGPLLRPPTTLVRPEPPPGALRAHAYQFVSRVFDRPRKHPKAIGFVRRNQILQATERVGGAGCPDGAWYRLAGPGYVCSRDGFAISRTPRAPIARQPLPAVDRGLPFDYAKAHDGALRYLQLPSAEQEGEALAALAANQRLPDYVDEAMNGIYLLALDRKEESNAGAFYRTVRGRYVPADGLDLKPEPGMRGELLGVKRSLPLAFVYGDGPATLYRLRDGERVEAGTADAHARFEVAEETAWDGVPMLVAKGGLAVERTRARLVEARARHENIPPGVKWIHVDLDEQALVAYEGDDPVFATLVSSGKGAEHATPTGLFRIREKHLSTTMSGPDPDAGYYEVEEVPWTMYYHDSFALHGAYWHDEFGNTRSHGCTNISPVDARWLFYWTDDALPASWNALRKLHGTHVLLTRVLPPQ